MQTVTPFFSATAASSLSALTQFAAPSSGVISPLLGSAGSSHL